jgi:hypothetical protein
MHCQLFSQRPSHIAFSYVLLLIFVSLTMNIITAITISSISVVNILSTVIIITAFLVRYLRSHFKIYCFHHVITTCTNLI